MRGGAELLGGSHVIISMQAAAISMQMPRSGPGGAVVHNTPGQGSTHRLFALLITALVLWSPVTASTQQTRGRDIVLVLVLKVRNCGVV